MFCFKVGNCEKLGNQDWPLGGSCPPVWLGHSLWVAGAAGPPFLQEERPAGGESPALPTASPRPFPGDRACLPSAGPSWLSPSHPASPSPASSAAAELPLTRGPHPGGEHRLIQPHWGLRPLRGEGSPLCHPPRPR